MCPMLVISENEFLAAFVKVTCRATVYKQTDLQIISVCANVTKGDLSMIEHEMCPGALSY